MTKTNRMPGARKALTCMTAAVLAASMSVPSTALAEPTSAEKTAEAQAALSTLNSMQQTLDEASANYGKALEEHDAAVAAQEECQQKIDSATEEISQLQDDMGERMRASYRSGASSISSILSMFLDSTSFKQLTEALDYMDGWNQETSDMVARTKELREEVEEQKAEADRQEQIAAEKTATAEAAKNEAEATVASMQATYDSLSAEAAALLEQERAAQTAAQAAQAQATVEASAQEAQQQQQSGGTSNGGGSSSGGSSDNGGSSSGGSSSGGSSNSGGSSSGGSSSQPEYNPSTGNAVVDRAYSQLGKPYVWGGVGPDGFDCSGLVSYALTGSYTRLGTTYTFMGWPQVSDPQPGDICTSSTHCGIYIGGGQMIHAATFGVGVIIGPVQSDMIIVRY